MRILFSTRAPELAKGGPNDTLGRLKRRIEGHFGVGSWINEIPEPADIEAVVAILAPSDADPKNWSHPEAEPLTPVLEFASNRGLPLIVGLTEGALVPHREHLPREVRALADAPTVDVSGEELIWVLEGLQEEPAEAVRRLYRRPTRTSRSVVSAKPEAQPQSMSPLRRDPILMRISGTAGALGMMLWFTLGFGPASLFLFLSVVTFLISRTDDPEADENGERRSR